MECDGSNYVAVQSEVYISTINKYKKSGNWFFPNPEAHFKESKKNNCLKRIDNHLSLIFHKQMSVGFGV